MRHVVIISLCLCLGLGLEGQQSEAQWAVEDAAALAQRAGIWIEEAAQWAESLSHQVKEVEATYNVILNQVKQYETMITNLKRIPEGVNVLDVVRQWSSQITGLLGRANIVTYDINGVLGQFNQLYEQVGAIQNAGDVFALRQRLLAGRMEASGITVQVTAVKQNLTELYGRMCTLLDTAYTASGNLDIQQVQAMQNGLIQHTLESMATMQAAAARNTAQYQAEQAAIERLQLQAIERAMGPAAPLGEPQGKLPRFHW